jgi:hypothetical protein
LLQYIGNRIKESVSDLFQPNKTAKPNINKIVHHLKEAEGKKNKKNTCFTIRNICLLIESSAHNEGSSLGPMHRSTEPVKIITCVQKLDTCQDLNGCTGPNPFPTMKMNALQRRNLAWREHLKVFTGPIHLIIYPQIRRHHFLLHGKQHLLALSLASCLRMLL